MSSDTRDHDDMNEDATRPGEKATVPPPADLYDGEEYGDDRIIGVAEKHKGSTPSEFLQALFSDVRIFNADK